MTWCEMCEAYCSPDVHEVEVWLTDAQMRSLVAWRKALADTPNKRRALPWLWMDALAGQP